MKKLILILLIFLFVFGCNTSPVIRNDTKMIGIDTIIEIDTIDFRDTMTEDERWQEMRARYKKYAKDYAEEKLRDSILKRRKDSIK